MILTELAAQNLNGFPPTMRVALGARLTALVAPQADVFALLRALLYPSEADAQLAGPASPRKAALTLQGHDGQTYRLVRDLDAGRVLLRSDPATRQAIRVSDDEAEIDRLLMSLIGLPPAESFEALWGLEAARLPSRAAPASARPPVDPLAATLPPTAHGLVGLEAPPANAAEARRKLPELRQELARVERFERAQDEIYDLQAQIAELRKGRAQVDALEVALQEATARVEAFRRVRELTAGLEARIRKFPEAAARRDGALAELKKKRSELEDQVRTPPTLGSLFQDHVFLGGLGAGLLCVAGALLLELRWLWALDLAGFGAAAFAAWRWVGEVEDADSTRRRLSDLTELERRIERQYDAEVQPVLAVASSLQLAGPAEVQQKLEELDMQEARCVAASRELEALRQDPAQLELQRQIDAVEQQVREREQLIADSGFVRESSLVRREIAVCEAMVADGAGLDPLPEIVDPTATLLGTDPRALLESVRDRLAQYLGALTDRRFVGVLRLAHGEYHVVATGGAHGPMDGIAPSDRDLVCVAVRLALFERVLAAGRLPLVVDLPSQLVDPAHQALFLKMLKSLSQRAQVLVCASNVPPAGFADTVAVAGAPAVG